jgi:nucleoid-associated protein
MTQPQHTITDLVIHKLLKAQHGPASIELHPGTTPLTDSAVRLVERLCRHYAERPGKGYGRFEDDEDDFPMPRLMRQHVLEQRIDFLTLSQQMMQHLQVRAEREELATGGFVLIARMNDFGADCLWVALLTETLGTAITGNLEIVDSPQLDFGNLRVAGRIDLSAWQQGAERYISFLKGRGDVALYFKLFLGCNDVVLALKETQKLVQTLGHFAEAQKLEASARDELMQRAHSYLDDLGESSAPLNLDRIAREVWPSAPERLDETLHDAALELASGFVPDRRALRPLVRFRASAQQWKVEFDRSSLRSGAVHYDRASDTLVLSDIPDHLRRMLLEE